VLYSLARSALFQLDPERAHDLTLKSLSALGPGAALLGAGVDQPDDARRTMGLQFPNAIGLAAGLDKNGAYLDALGLLGFGFVEIGTVTPRPQPGNPRPRLFRLEEHEAIINRLGFNNDGVEKLLRNVERSRYRGVLGINIGKNLDTPIERAAEDYVACLEAVYPRATYVTVNISSPNTKNLRDLQSSERLDELLGRVMATRAALAQGMGVAKPLLVKVAPDLDDAQVEVIARLAVKHAVDGLIATNTTVSREAIAGHRHALQNGGLSGRPLYPLATRVLQKLATALAGRVPLVGVGGILSGADARGKIEAGATLVQVYTGFVYRGPALIGEARAALRVPH
jgi:dihydroorotate dehydrogenase